MKEASEILGISYRAVRYYKPIYENEVHQEGREIRVTDRFIDLVRNNIRQKARIVTDKTTKQEYREQLQALQDQLSQQNATLKKMRSALEKFEGYDYDPETERLEIFTYEEYQQFQNALQEWKSQRQVIEVKEESFKAQLATKEELIEHYRQQFDYQRQQSDKILEQMGKLIESIKRRETIEAVEKNVIGKNVDLD
jgi:hypothetical protein